ncbi:phosphotyrosine protein phosphatase I superfamily [Zopfochytrium polystomum]|nr:phosphotyrosine protein phosphatase I superfamily [Zopfochytrium polystomum]
MPSVLFVCLGNNICRSPMAEAVFRHVVNEMGLADEFPVIDSAGTAGYRVVRLSPQPPDPGRAATCRKNGVPRPAHPAQESHKAPLKPFDYNLLHGPRCIQPKGSKAVVKLFGDYDPKGDRIIRDPYYGGQDGFDRNFAQVSRCSRAFIESLGFGGH